MEGNASPRLVDVGGQYRLYLGNETGKVWVYDNIDNNLLGQFNRLNTRLDSLHQGEETHVALADLNGDGLLDVVVGNKRGGLSIYGTGTFVSVRQTQLPTLALRIFPNPTQHAWTIAAEQTPQEEATVTLYNALGQQLQTTLWPAGDNTYQLDAAALSSGSYWVQIQRPEGQYNELIIKK